MCATTDIGTGAAAASAPPKSTIPVRLSFKLSLQGLQAAGCSSSSATAEHQHFQLSQRLPLAPELRVMEILVVG